MSNLQFFEQYLASEQRGRYSLFDYAVRCSSSDDYPTYCHEYLHHIQNVTTIRGAERLSSFMQIAAHLSGLCSVTDSIRVPLVKWHAQSQDATEAQRQELQNIAEHWNAFLYWEQWFRFTHLENDADRLEILLESANVNAAFAILRRDVFKDNDVCLIPCILERQW